jgi:ACT domain
MLFSLRVAVPDRPGMLATITGLIAARGLDVRAIDVLGGRLNEAVDAFLLDGEPEQLDELVVALRGVPGVVVLGLRRSGMTKDSSPELDLIAALAREPGRVLEVLTDACPRILAADWALGFATDESLVRARTAWAPDVAWSGRQPMRSSRVARYGSFSLPDDVNAELAVAAVTGVGVVLVGRTEGPAFHDAEILRLDKLMKTVESVLAAIQTAGSLTAFTR